MNKRIKKYLETIDNQSFTVIFSGVAPQKSADQNYPFVVNRNFYYLTGIDQADSILLICKGTSQQAYLFLEKRSPERILWDGDVLSFEEAHLKSEIDFSHILDRSLFDNFIKNLLSPSRKAVFGELKNLYLDLDYMHDHFKTLALQYSETMVLNYPHLDVLNAHLPIARLRQVKDDKEVDDIKHAIEITNQGLKRILDHLKPGLKEYELDNEFNYVLGKHQTVQSFDTIAASGIHATVLHYVDNNQTLKPNDLILFDLGNTFNHYASDISRTYPISGKFTQRQKDIYEVVLKANKETIKWLKPGITFQEYNEYGKKILIEGAKALGLIKEDHEIGQYYYHSLGHFLGLDVHDVGDYTKVLEPGNIITIEPGLYIKEEGIGVRIEDDILITEDGCINLSKDIIKEVHEIEDYLAKRR